MGRKKTETLASPPDTSMVAQIAAMQDYDRYRDLATTPANHAGTWDLLANPRLLLSPSQRSDIAKKDLAGGLVPESRARGFGRELAPEQPEILLEMRDEDDR